MKKRKERCENCKYWDEDPGKVFGVCFYNPPVIIPTKKLTDYPDDHEARCLASMFPSTVDMQFCSKWESKKK